MTEDAPEAVSTTDAGLSLARQALAAARAEARRRGQRSGSTAAAPPRETRGTSSWRRGEELRSGAGPDDRDPQLLGGAVPRLLASQGWEERAAVSDTLTNWPAVVGEDLAAHCSPQGIVKGVLTIDAVSSSWATQLRLLASVLRDRVNEHLVSAGGPGVEMVREVRVRGPEAPSWRKGALSVKGRGPRDTYG